MSHPTPTACRPRIWNWNSLTGNRKSANLVVNGVEVAITRPWLVIPRRLRPSGMRNGPISYMTWNGVARLANDLGFGQKQLLPGSQEVGDDTASVVCAWLRRSYATQEPRNTAEHAGVELRKGTGWLSGACFGLGLRTANPQNPKAHFRRPPAPRIWEPVF